MKLFLQILLIFLTWFSNIVNATPAFSKVALPSCKISFPKTENHKQKREVKIGALNFARSGVSENSLYQKANLQESYVLENRARGKY